jgi:hypothetical protein
MYVDDDGDTILETKEELREFMYNTPCAYCAQECRDLLSVMEGKAVAKLKVSTTCEHMESV